MKLSVIIPVYNVEQYLPMCLDSILSQNYNDYEIICVNDGSTDSSLSILKRYESDKVIVINKENEGSGVARNVGMKFAKGEYIWFVDGDDWIEENSLRQVVEQAENNSVDILIFGGLSCYENRNSKLIKKQGGYSANNLPHKYLNRIFSSDDIKSEIFKFPSTAWTKLYRRLFLIENKILFQNIKVGQDQLPFFHSMIVADKIALFNKNCYCYRKNRSGSAMTVKKKKNFSPIYVFYAIENLLTHLDKLDVYKDIFVNRYFSKATSWLGKFQNDLKEEYFSEYMNLLKHIQIKYKGWWLYFKPGINDRYTILKLKIFVAKLSFNLFRI